MTPTDARHGTPAGKHAHRRANTPLCEPCRLAHNAQKRKWKRLPENECLSCTRRTTAVDKVCRSCRHREDQAAKVVPDDFALTGGQWVPRDGIMRWEAAA